MDVFLLEYLIAWQSSFVIVELFANSFLWWSSKGTNSTINEYYTRVPTYIVVLGDFLYSTLIFLIALALYRYITQKQSVSLNDWWIFIIIFVCVQWTLDLTWALVVKSLVSNGITNRYLDFFNRYANEVGIKAVIGDTMYGLCWLILFAIMLTKASDILKYFLIVLGLFILVIMSF